MTATQRTEASETGARELTDADIDALLRRVGERERKWRMAEEERARQEIANSPWAKFGGWVVLLGAIGGAVGWLAFVTKLLEP